MKSSFLEKCSDSFKEFFQYIQNMKTRYSLETNRFVWKTNNTELKNLLYSHASDIVEIFGIFEEGKNIPEPKPIEITEFDPDLYNALPVQENKMLITGGLPALWTAYFISEFYSTEIKNKTVAPALFILPYNYKYSATLGSSLQYHVSHASPMYTDKEFSAFIIVLKSIIRNLINNPMRGAKDNFMIADINLKLLQNPKIMRVSLAYLLNELNYKIRNMLGLRNITHDNIDLAIKSGVIMDKVSEKIGETILFRNNTVRVAYDKAETQEFKDLAKILNNFGVKCDIIDKDSMLELTGTVPELDKHGSFYSIVGDGNVNYNIIDILCKTITSNGAELKIGYVEQILTDKDNKNKIYGAVINHDNEKILIRTEQVCTSLGVNSEFNRKSAKIIPGTGISSFIVVDAEIKRPIDSNNNHFTPIKSFKVDDITYTLIKTTCGGNIGQRAFCIDHAINNLFYAAHIIFPNNKVEIIAARPCSRAINGKNSYETEELLPGFINMYGFGGKGITDAPACALTEILPKLVHKENVNEFIAKYLD